MASAVLRGDDQRAGRAPTHCVLTGVRTTTAVHEWALGVRRPALWAGLFGAVAPPLARLLRVGVLPVTIPIDAAAHASWTRRAGASLVAMCFGLGCVVVGATTHDGGFVALGLVLVVGGAAYRARSRHNFWITLRYRPDRDDVLISPVHHAFDADARELFRRAVSR